MPFYGFVAHLTDGRQVRESDCYWDAVPHGIKHLAIAELYQDREPVEVLSFDGAPDRQFFFYNELVAARNGYGFLAAKSIGYVDKDQVIETRLDFMPNLDGKPAQKVTLTYSTDKLRLVETALRRAG